MTRWIAAAAGLAILAIANFGTLGRERLLAEGLLVPLETVPVDSCFLLQSDPGCGASVYRTKVLFSLGNRLSGAMARTGSLA